MKRDIIYHEKQAICNLNFVKMIFDIQLRYMAICIYFQCIVIFDPNFNLKIEGKEDDRIKMTKLDLCSKNSPFGSKLAKLIVSSK